MTGGRAVLLIGDPVGHSVSPAMQRAAFAATGLEGWTYEARRTPPGRLEATWRELRTPPGRVAGDGSLAGMNVTIPHKEAVMALVDEVAPHARRAGSVNTVVMDGSGRAIGDSTDGAGFLAALRLVDGRPRRRAVVLGTGGAARAVAAALRGVGSAVLVLGRNPAAGERIAKDLDVTFEPWTPGHDGLLRRALRGADLVANATPVGADDPAESPLPETVVPDPGTTVFDLVYRPRRTRLLEQAAAAGCAVVEGIEMLIEQGARSFQMWTGLAAPVDVMRAAAYRALDGQVG
jgi:shikimate dehydrogenase